MVLAGGMTITGRRGINSAHLQRHHHSDSEGVLPDRKPGAGDNRGYNRQ